MANTKPNSAFPAGKKIIIAGAGISGLSFAIALHKFWLSQDPSIPPFTITFYERDSAIPGPDREGYSLSIRSDGQSGGMKTLKNLGLVDLLLSRSITGIQGAASGNFCLWDKEWEEIMRMGPKTLSPGTPHPHMRIARNVLRQTLVEAVPKQSKIHWGTACMGAVEMSNGRVGVQLSNGKVDECDLLIAADGSKSKIRMSLRPEDKLNYAGAVCIGGNAKFSGEIPEPANKDWGAHLTGTGTGLFVSPIDEHSAVWNISYLSPAPRALIKQPWSEEQRKEVLKEALERGKSIAEPFATYVKATDMATLQMLNTMDKPGFSHKELKNTRIVFIGDANHAVSPFAGNGANMALEDGWDLAEQLCKHESLEAALVAYDALSVPRAKTTLRMSHFVIGVAHSQGWRLMLYTLLFRILNRLLPYLFSLK